MKTPLWFILLVACGQGVPSYPTGPEQPGQPPPPSPPPPPTPVGEARVQMTEAQPWDYGPPFYFSPESVTITRPGTVNWTNPTGVMHNVTFSPATGAPTDIPTYSSGSVVRNFSTAGTFTYRCTLHAGMAGQVIVR